MINSLFHGVSGAQTVGIAPEELLCHSERVVGVKDRVCRYIHLIAVCQREIVRNGIFYLCGVIG